MMRALLHMACRILLLAACALILGGCDAFYRIIVENYTDQPVVLDVFGRTTTLKPCYVSDVSQAGPLYGTDSEARLLSETGEVLLTRSFRVEKSRRGEAQEPDQLLDYVIIRYPPEGSVGCNEPKAAGYLLTILNATQETLDVTIGGVALEDMLPSEEREVLLEEGTPYRPPAPVVLDSEGRNRFRRGGLKYIGTFYEHPVDEMARARMRIK